MEVDETETETETGTGTGTDTEGTTTRGTTAMTTGRTDGPTTDPTRADVTTDRPSETTTDDCPVGTENCLCDIGAVCEDGLVCQDGTCVAPPACEQPEGEPNDDEAGAIELPELGCDGGSATTSGALDGVDADWFTFHGNPGIACFGGPSAQVTADSDIVVCMYFECDQGTTMVQCDAAATAGDSPDGRPGCCGTNRVDVDSVDCGFGNGEAAQVWVRASAADAVCLGYELEYEF
jgi:hypothetical protein